MATYTPVALIPTSLWTSSVTSYSSPSGTIGIIRTITFAPNAGIAGLRIALGADAPATRMIYDGATAQVSNFSGLWIETDENDAHAIDASTYMILANQGVGSIGGYTYG